MYNFCNKIVIMPSGRPTDKLSDALNAVVMRVRTPLNEAPAEAILRR